MDRKFIIATIFLLVVTQNSFGQNSSNKLFADNNPKLTEQESQWLNERFKTENFNFKNKYIGFVELLSGGFYGIGKFTLPQKKKSLLQLDLNKFHNKLIVLDSTQKIGTWGYDALLVFVLKKNEGKLKRLNIEKLISEEKNRYPQIPTNAGLDTNSNLNAANAIFFNELYKADLYPKTDYDFNGKKVAIFNTHCQFDKVEIVNLAEYVKRIKSQLDTYGFSMTDFTYYLDAEQKKDSGGYDVIIQYLCKKDLPVTYLIKLLKQNGT